MQQEGVRYHDGITVVQLGDRVEVRGLILFFRKKQGRVNYVPGISRRNPEMEHGGLTWVGVIFDDGTRTGAYVDPNTQCLLKIVTFLERDLAPIQELGPDEPVDG